MKIDQKTRHQISVVKRDFLENFKAADANHSSLTSAEEFEDQVGKRGKDLKKLFAFAQGVQWNADRLVPAPKTLVEPKIAKTAMNLLADIVLAQRADATAYPDNMVSRRTSSARHAFEHLMSKVDS